MSSILNKILANKEEEIIRLQQLKPLQGQIDGRKKNSMITAFKNNKKMNIIAEIKRASPSKGVINDNINPEEQAQKYVENGATAISVLTDTTFFQGSFHDLAVVRDVVDVPLLCKDFIIDEIQIDVAKQAGADVILLIVAAMPENKLKRLYQYATRNQLEVLVEVHNLKELKIALNIGAVLLGINNRNLITFEVDLAVTEQLAKEITKEEVLIISESGIRDREDVVRVGEAGAVGILIGETLMRASNLAHTFAQLTVEKVNGK
jgi:indole-3-glycerol phosphate synthase